MNLGAHPLYTIACTSTLPNLTWVAFLSAQIVACFHEIGHALGFSSGVGFSELIPGFPPVPSVLDLFRFRPHVNLPTFGSEERVLSSGGEQVFFGLSPELEFSTGRPDGTGGDGFQASHWKLIVVNQNQPPIGVMVPAFGFGERHVITNNDLRAFNAIGYSLSSE